LPRRVVLALPPGECRGDRRCILEPPPNNEGCAPKIGDFLSRDAPQIGRVFACCLSLGRTKLRAFAPKRIATTPVFPPLPAARLPSLSSPSTPVGEGRGEVSHHTTPITAFQALVPKGCGANHTKTPGLISSAERESHGRYRQRQRWAKLHAVGVAQSSPGSRQRRGHDQSIRRRRFTRMRVRCERSRPRRVDPRIALPGGSAQLSNACGVNGSWPPGPRVRSRTRDPGLVVKRLRRFANTPVSRRRWLRGRQRISYCPP
jgi:hypothetical protein